jgi:uncharacterized membrane protein YdfJ with MMPL/SSD domain
MARTAVLAERGPVATLLVTVALGGTLGVWGLSQLETRFSATEFVAPDNPILAALDAIEDRFGGGFGETTEVLITGDATRPEVHNALVDATAELPGIEWVTTIDGQPVAESPVSVLASLLALRVPYLVSVVWRALVGPVDSDTYVAWAPIEGATATESDRSSAPMTTARSPATVLAISVTMPQVVTIRYGRSPSCARSSVAARAPPAGNPLSVGPQPVDTSSTKAASPIAGKRTQTNDISLRLAEGTGCVHSQVSQ